MRHLADHAKTIKLTSRIRSNVLTISLCLALGLLIVVPANVEAGPHDLDATFGNLGIVRSSPDGTNKTLGISMALQADGKIVMTGIPTPDNTGFLVARYNADGSPDMTFASVGWAMALFPGQDFVHARSIEVQADGKVLVGGQIGGVVDGAPNWRYAFARFNTDGTPDDTFDGDGKLIVDLTPPLFPNQHEVFDAMKVASDGKIVVAGHAVFQEQFRFVFLRLQSDGSRDATFGSNGLFLDATTSVGNNCGLHDLTILADGTFVAVGWRHIIPGSFRFAVKINATGTARVWTYESGVFTQAGGEVLHGIAQLPDGKFIVVGDKARQVVAQRLNSNGTEDNTFSAPTMPVGYSHAVALQADGKIVANVNFAAGSSFSLVRYNSNGSLDTTFGVGGIATITGGYNGLDLFVQPDGKILVGGWELVASDRFFAMARYRGGEFVPGKTEFDYDGDNKADVSVYRSSNATWYLDRSTAGFTAMQFGISTDRIVPADYDGDNKADLAVYRNGLWWILNSSNSTVRVNDFGIAEDKPQPGDFDGDGMDDIAVWRPSTGYWYIFRSSDFGYHGGPFGTTGDIPQRGDYDDDGKTDAAVWRPSNGTWYIQRSGGGLATAKWGVSTDIPVAADYDGDNKPDLAVWRPSNGEWFILKSSTPGFIQRAIFGVAGDIPIPADYDGDGKADIAQFRPSTGFWYQMRSTGGQAAFPFGLPGDRPTPASFGP